MTSQTLNFKLNLPEFDLRTWHKLVNQNFEVVDAVLQQYLSVQNLQGVWLNSTHYLVGQAVVDEVQGIIYTCKVEHTSAAVPTLFAADRAANSSYWGGIATPEHFRGVWAANTTYAVRDFVVSGAIYAVCITAHTSNIAGVFGNDAAFWTYLVNLSGFNLPSITGHGTHFLRARADETGLEYRTPAQVAADIGAGTGTVTTVNTGVGLIGGGFTTAGIISLADTAVVPGTYAMPGSIQIDQQGRIIAASAAGFAAAAVALVTAAANFAGDLTTTSTDAAAGAGPLLSMDRNSASPAVADILGHLRWLGRSSTAVQREYAGILANILDPVNATEDAQMDFRTIVAGTASARMSLAQGMFSPSATGGDKGADSINAKNYYRDGALIDRRVPTVHANGYTQVAADEFVELVANSGGAVGWTMLAGATFGAGAIQHVSCEVAGTVLTLTRAGTDTFASGGVTNLTTLVLNTGDRGFLVSDGGAPAIWRFHGIRHFESAQQTITNAGLLTIAHGLGVRPTHVNYALVCTTAANNYSINDVIEMFNFEHGSAGIGESIVPDATNFVIRQGATTPAIMDKTSGITAGMTAANYRLIFRAWIYN